MKFSTSMAQPLTYELIKYQLWSMIMISTFMSLIMLFHYHFNETINCKLLVTTHLVVLTLFGRFH